ncbi:hypothetical protein [Mycobacterium sp. TY815]|uniref:hypothetical protein n=1 Tax=Mycobacterium sp. TY815 TaxID=3050581 RepID=UPI0027411F27|nr:hypothetical protein [Mycobacterium sp. TY815]MDP7706814.1 hypothetical protein [Mycobacterium sp. TY815]
MALTSDPNDPRLTRGIDTEAKGQADTYLTLSDAERAKGFVRPVRRTYVHARGTTQQKPACGQATTMSLAIAETYARDPSFYGATFCVGCQMHLPVNEFDWDDGSQVGS